MVTIPTPRDGWIRIETFRMSPRMRQPGSAVAQSDYTTHHVLLLLLEHLAIFSGKHSPPSPDFGKKLSSLVPITNSSESSCQSQKHPQNDCRRQSWCSMDRWPGTLHGRDISPGDFYCFYFHCQLYNRIGWGQTWKNNNIRSFSYYICRHFTMRVKINLESKICNSWLSIGPHGTQVPVN